MFGFHVHHFAPHISGPRFAVLDLSLDGGLKSLNIVENERESDQTGADSYGRKDNSREGNSPKGAFLLFHLKGEIFKI